MSVHPLALLLDDDTIARLRERALRGRGHAITATTVASSGHPGGSMSSMEIYTLLYSHANLRPDEPRWAERDRIVISHGHTSPGVYGALAEAGFFPAEEFVAHFRQAGSVFEGHVERAVPGIEWSSGNLGQGLSAGVGFALGARMTGASWRTFVVMSDGEQHKGQVGEARRLAVKENLDSLIAIVDWNHIQISGRTDDVMPVAIASDWAADGWHVIECDGHDLAALSEAVRQAIEAAGPTVVLAHTIIGKGVSFMEGTPEFHGRGLTAEEYPRAMTELHLDPAALEAAKVRRTEPCTVTALPHRTPAVPLVSGEPRTLDAGEKADCRGAWGAALTDVAAANPDVPMAVFDCDLAVSVKTDGFAKLRPTQFIQCGVGEHNVATAAGALSTVPGVVALWADFGAFGLDEVYNQQRLNDINGAAVKVALTHCGLDVGEDGKTHQCIDYIGALRSLFGWSLIVPADANQTDRAVRAAIAMPGNVAMAMGRSKLPVITGEDGVALFGDGYEFRYGEIVWAREGDDACVLCTGTVAGSAVAAADLLRDEGITVEVGIVACPLALDEAAIRYAAQAPLVITVEDHNALTGLGASVALAMADEGAGTRLVRFGVDDYQPSGASEDLFALCGLDASGIASRVRKALAER
ncbi:MAG: transketolase [Coriobacteriia bacterium]|nr:transketolase [Coriobacteriia bacterium]